MLRTPPSSSRLAAWLTGLTLVWLLATPGLAAACTANGDFTMTPTVQRSTGTGGMGATEGLKLRTSQQELLVRNTSLTERPPAPLAKSEPEAPPSYRSLAMLAAALAVMVSIALRRSGKR